MLKEWKNFTFDLEQRVLTERERGQGERPWASKIQTPNRSEQPSRL